MDINEALELGRQLINENNVPTFILTDLAYTINYGEKQYEKFLQKVDTLNYKLIDLGPEQIADIVINAAQVNGLKLDSMDSSMLDYNSETGNIKNVRPISLIDNNGEQKGTISFEMILWTHPKTIERV